MLGSQVLVAKITFLNNFDASSRYVVPGMTIIT